MSAAAAGARPVAVVTGASRGIGHAIARRLARRWHVVATARTGADLEQLAGQIRHDGGECTPLVMDVADPRSIASALAGVEADVLVNNAGVARLVPFMELTAEDWHRMVDVNVNALFHVTRALLPGMMERGRGHVVTIGSLAGRNTFAGGSCYAATKHAVMGFTESLLLEVRDRGVKVSVVMPGSVATELFPEGTDTSWMLVPDDVAETVAQVVEAPGNVLVGRVEVRPAFPGKR